MRASVSTPPAGLVEAIAARYRLDLDGPHGRLGRLQGGYENDLFLIRGASGQYVIRIEAGDPDPAGMAWEHALVAVLAEKVQEVVRPVAARDGSTFFVYEGHAVSLLPFVDGRPAHRDRDWEAAARLLGRLHAATGTHVPPRAGQPSLYERDWSLPPVPANAPSALVEAEARLGGELARCTDWLLRTPLPCGPIHGDYYRGNVLFSHGRVVGLVDWREAHVDAWAYELANGLWEFCKEGDNFARDRGARFAAAYRAEGGVVPPEHDVYLEPLIRCRRLVEVTRAMTRETLSVDWDYQLHNLRALDSLG